MEITTSHETHKHSSIIPMVVLGGLFFMFGFVTWLNGSLIPFLQIACELSHMQAFLVTMAFYISYTVMAVPMSVVLKKTGYKQGMVIGLIIMAVGSLIFIPAAETRTFAIFLLGLFTLGSGLTILQTASNPYVVHIGPHESAAVRISIMGLMNKGAGIVAPVVFSALMLSNMDAFTEDKLSLLTDAEKHEQLTLLSGRLIMPYIVMATMLSVLAAFVYFSPLPELSLGEKNNTHKNDSVFKHPRLILGVIALFFYVGVEVIAGDTIGLFGKELGLSNFGQLTAYTMGFMVLSYLLGIVIIPRFISQEAALVFSASLGIILSLLVMLSSGVSYSLWNILFGWLPVPAIPNVILFIALLGLANALVWPAIWPMALKDLGELTSTGSALLIMAIAGGAVFPFLYGLLSDISGDSRISYWIMLPCYSFILFYAIKGHKIITWK